jgi:ABC-type multidrug transport system ATPase subunit
MTIQLSDAGKRFNRDWIFRKLTYTFTPTKSYAIIGPNGSGKSTLLQCLAGAIGLNEGHIQFQLPTSSTPIASNKIYQYVAVATPALELIEELTLTEFLLFHQSFKPLLPQLSIETMIAAVQLTSAAHKQIRYYSSGMKQRAKLAQAIFSNVPVVLLDEPCTNLDAQGISMYHALVHQYCRNRLLIVSSNDETEYSFCEEKINMK